MIRKHITWCVWFPDFILMAEPIDFRCLIISGCIRNDPAGAIPEVPIALMVLLNRISTLVKQVMML